MRADDPPAQSTKTYLNTLTTKLQLTFTFYLSIRSPPSSEVSQSRSACPSSRQRGTFTGTEQKPAWSTSGLKGTRCTPAKEAALPPVKHVKSMSHDNMASDNSSPGLTVHITLDSLCCPSYTNTVEENLQSWGPDSSAAVRMAVVYLTSLKVKSRRKCGR